MSSRSRAKRRAGATGTVPPARQASLPAPRGAALPVADAGAPSAIEFVTPRVPALGPDARASPGVVPGVLAPAAAAPREALALGAAWLALCFGLLCGAGAIAGELTHHLPGAWIAQADVALAVAAGLLLWRAMPSHPLIRRLDVAVLILALLLAAACALTLWLEALRSGLVRRSTLPAGLLRGLLVAPVWMLAAGAAAWGRSVLPDAWSTGRAALPPARLAAIALLGAAAASVTAWASRVSDLIAAPSALFAAALLITALRLERFHHHRPADHAGRPARFPRAAAGAALLATLAAAILIAVALRPPRPAAAAPASDGSAAAAVRALLAARSPRCVTFVNPHAVTAGAAWELDLDGPACDVIILSPQSAPGELRRADARRLLRRLAAALVHGGRLIIENPQPSQVEAAFWILRHDLTWPRTIVAAVVVPGDRQPYEALVLGPDLSAWLAQQAESQPAARPGGVSGGAISDVAARVRYEPARGPRHFDSLRAAARR